VRLDGLGKLKKCFRLIGSRTRNLPACNIMLPRAPVCANDADLSGENTETVTL
jgi:hypothetical protein